MSKQTVLVCGATGFIGRNLIEALSRNPEYSVVGVHFNRPKFAIPGVRWIRADLTDGAQAREAINGVDILIQAAATTSGSKDIVNQPQIHVTDNAVMNSHLFRHAFEARIRQVIFFSCSVMLQSSQIPQTEDDFDPGLEIHPRYFGSGWTKVYLEKMCEFYGGLGSTRFTAIRHSNVYGQHDKFDLARSHVLGATVTKVMTAIDHVTVWGTGTEARDFVYVNDLVDFVQRAIQLAPPGFSLYNCGTGIAVTVNDLVARVIQVSGKKLAVKHDLTLPTIPTCHTLDCKKAREHLGWGPTTALDDGLRKTIDWWRSNIGVQHEHAGMTDLGGAA